eukprot:15023693-Alexandrium_andersonii.AAC.1
MPPQAAGQRRLEPVPEPSDVQGLRRAALPPLQPRVQGGVDHPPGPEGTVDSWSRPPGVPLTTEGGAPPEPPRRAERIVEVPVEVPVPVPQIIERVVE